MVQFLRVSNGGFGKALEDFTNTWKVEDKAIGLLQKSPTFMKLVATLDQHYIWLNDPTFDEKPSKGSKLPSSHSELEMGSDGRVVKPPSAAGKRALVVMRGESSFVTYNTPGNIRSSDVLSLDESDTSTFIQAIAHEATHAAAIVGGPAPHLQTLVAEIEAGIQNEIAARTSEAKILGEIPDPKVRARIGQVGSRNPREVERDVSPAFNLTYLELFFFGRELRDVQADEGLTDQEALKIREEVEKNPTVPTIVFRERMQVGKILYDYPKIWFDRQTAVREWEKFMKNHSPNDPTFATEKEKLVQDHAKRFFKGKVSYRP